MRRSLLLPSALAALLGCRSAADRRIEAFTGGSGIATELRRELRDLASAFESIRADDGRYDAILLTGGGFTPQPGGAIVLLPADSTWEGWALFAVGDSLSRCHFDFGADSAIKCGTSAPPASTTSAPRIFSAKWVADTTHPIGMWRRLTQIPPARFMDDSLLAHEMFGVTSTATGWKVTRDAYNWSCVMGTGTLVPSGAEPLGIICTAHDLTPPRE